MLLISDEKTLSREIDSLRKSGKLINFIPTMGNLHLGHTSLFKKSENTEEIRVVSIFVNPLQFNDDKDFDNYPRTIESDKKKLLAEGVDVLFLPDLQIINVVKFAFRLGHIARKLCGVDRSGHFEGVAKIILKFLDIIKPDSITLGEKDYQQLLVIKKIIKDLKLKTEVRSYPTIRNKDGIALSSRNKLLGKKIFLAKYIPTIFKQINLEILEGSFELRRLNYFKDFLGKSGVDRVHYLEILNEKNLSKLTKIPCISRIFIAISISGIRLIDNMRIESKLACSRDGQIIIYKDINF